MISKKVRSTILSLGYLEKPFHHVLGVISDPIMEELVRDVLLGTLDLGSRVLSKAKINIP